MNKKLFRTIGISCVACAAVLLPAGCSLVPMPQGRWANGHVDAINERWELSIPDQCATLYANHGKPAMKNVGEWYHVLQFSDSDSADWWSGFSAEREKTFESEVDAHLAAFAAIKGYEVPEEYLPDWGKEYFWQHLEQPIPDPSIDYIPEEAPYRPVIATDLYMVYYPESFTLYVCEYIV